MMFKKFFLAAMLLSSVAVAQPKLNAHKDYLHPKPFTAALHGGAWSIEVDVVAKDGVLYLANDLTGIDEEKTLQKLYIETASRLGQRKKSQMFHLLINIKDSFDTVYPILNKMVKPHVPGLAYKMQLVLTGNIPEPKEWTKYPAYFMFEGNLDGDYDKKSLDRAVMLKASYLDVVSNAATAVEQLDAAVSKAARLGKPLRVTHTADGEESWKMQMAAGVGVIDSARTADFMKFLNQK